MTLSEMRCIIGNFKYDLNNFWDENSTERINDICYFLDRNLDDLDDILAATESPDPDKDR